MPYSKTIQTVKQTMLETHQALKHWFDKPQKALQYRPYNQGWSIQEVLEHITLTNHYLMIIIRKGRDKAIKRMQAGINVEEGESDLKRLWSIGQAGSFQWHRPDHMEPTGNVPIEEVKQKLQQQHEECLQILDSMPHGEGALYKVRMSVQNLGKIDMYQWLYFLVLHQKRHLTQIERVWNEWKADRDSN